MARYKYYDYDQTLLIPVSFEKQIQPGTFEYTINYLIDNNVDTSIFEDTYANDDLGAPAYDPAIMLKIILFSYSRGIVSSRKVEDFCRENIVVKSLSANAEPDFTTIAHFICMMSDYITKIFSDTLLVCTELDLIGGEMFALDGCKMSSNASKEWSGTFSDLEKKKEKIEKTIDFLVKKHERTDKEDSKLDSEMQKEAKQIKKIQEKARKIEKFLKESEPKIGSRGKEKQSNITDNESAKMKTSHGVIQGYNGLALTDSKHQIIVYGEAFGSGSEQELLIPTMESAKEITEEIGLGEEYFKDKTFIADTGSFSEENSKYLANENIDAYIPDQQFRKRDPRFEARDRHRPAKKDARYKSYEKNQKLRNTEGRFYRSRYADCKICNKKKQCLKSEKSRNRSIYVIDTFFDRNYSEEMIQKIDTTYGRDMYSNRMGIVEPVFGNIRHCKRLDRFTLRKKKKVNIQWNLFCIVHNIGKILKFGDMDRLST